MELSLAVEHHYDTRQGYSEVLGLRTRRENGTLRFYDPETESYLRSHEDERAGRMEERARPLPCCLRTNFRP